MITILRRVCCDLVCDFKGFSVGEDVNKTKKEIVQSAIKVGINKVNV
jgi:hypothetical protein